MNTTHTNEPIEQKEKQKATRLLDELDLRDYFAAKAMQEQIGNPLKLGDDEAHRLIAERAFRMADTMLKAREQ